jgi:hypothetical protein
MNLSVSIIIEKPKHQVWQAITAIDTCDAMINGIIALEVLEKPESGLVGLKWQETRKMFGKEATETMWITEAEELTYYKTRAENCGAIYITKLSVETVGENTLLTMDFSGTSDSFFVRLMSSMMGLFMKKSMTKMLQDDLNDIKQFVESQ